MKLLQELSSLSEGGLKDALLDAIYKAMDKLDLYDFESHEAAVKGIMAEVNKHIDVDQDTLGDMVRDMYTEEDHEEALKEGADDSEWPKLIAQAGDFSVELDEDDKITMYERNTAIANMPLVIWKQLSRM